MNSQRLTISVLVIKIKIMRLFQSEFDCFCIDKYLFILSLYPIPTKITQHRKTNEQALKIDFTDKTKILTFLDGDIF